MFKPDLICLHETKLETVDDALIKNALGHAYDTNYVYLPGQGTRRGVLIAANYYVAKLSSPSVTNHTVSSFVHDLRCSNPWMVTGVYGPQGNLEKRCSSEN
jgi:exonuclease III